MAATGSDPSSIIDQENWSAGNSAVDINDIIDQVITQNPEQVEQYKAGKTVVLQFLIGMVMKQTKGMGSPEDIKSALEDKLK